MPDCIGVRFDNGPKIHYMEVPAEVPALGSQCVVSTKRGLELAQVRTDKRDAKPNGHFVREAYEEDLHSYYRLKRRAEELKWFLRAKAREHSIKVKVVSLEFTLDEKVLVVNYSTEETIPLRLLAKQLIEHSSARIEFNNIGPRDQARILGAIGSCGGGTCSSTWLQSFSAVSIRMARDQQLPLNPDKISGPCGRLLCCLQYEHAMYQELLATMPRRGSHVCHSSGVCGRVTKLYPLKNTVEIESEQGGHEEFPADELTKLPRQSSKGGSRRR